MNVVTFVLHCFARPPAFARGGLFVNLLLMFPNITVIMFHNIIELMPQNISRGWSHARIVSVWSLGIRSEGSQTHEVFP